GGEPARPIPDSYRVQPGRLLAGEYPGAKDTAEARAKLRRLLGVGVSFFLDPTEKGERPPQIGERLRPYEDLLQAEAAALGRPVEYHRLPISDLDVPTRDHMAAVLATIDEALA